MERQETKDRLFAMKTGILAFAVIACWGLTFISFRVTLNYFNSAQIMLLRCIIAYLSLWIIYPHAHKSEGLKQELLLLLTGGCGTTLYVILSNEALLRTGTANVSVFSSLSPIWTALLLPLFFRGSKISGRILIGFVIATIGAALVSTGGKISLGGSFLGDGLAIACGIIWAVYSILLRKIKSPYPQFYITRRIFLYGILLVIPVIVVRGDPIDFTAFTKPQAVLNLLFLGLVAYTFCHIGWATSIKRMGSVWTSQFTYLEPIVTMVGSVLILHEHISLVMIGGTVLILAGVIYADGNLLKRFSKAKAGAAAEAVSAKAEPVAAENASVPEA